MIRDPHNTPQDYGGGGEVSSGHDRPRKRFSGPRERSTPEDFGDGLDARDVTIRKLRLSDGVEIWNNGRGDANGGGYASCRAIYDFGDARLLTFGTPRVGNAKLPGQRWGTGVTFLDRGADAALGVQTTGEGEDVLNATQGRGPLWAIESQGLYWVVGRVDDGASGRIGVQAFDAATLESQFVTLLDASYSLLVENIGASPYGITINRTAPVVTNTGPRGIIERVDTDGSIGTAVQFERNNGQFVFGSTSYDGVSFSSISRVVCGPDGKVYFLGAKSTDGLDVALYVTDTDCGNPTKVASLAVDDGTGVGVKPYKVLASSRNEYYHIFGSAGFQPKVSDITLEWTEAGDFQINLRRNNTSGSVTPSGFNHQITAPIIDTFDVTGSLIATSRSLRPPGVQASVYDENWSTFYIYTLDVADGGTTWLGPMLTKETAGVVDWQTHYSVAGAGSSHTHWFPTTPYKVITAGGYHYVIGAALVYYDGAAFVTGHECCKVSAADGSLVWVARHHSTGGTESLLDGVIVGDYLYVCGEASSYRP